MDLLAETLEELAQDELRTRVDVDQPLWHCELRADEAAQWR
jgi:hypothetical protein